MMIAVAIEKIASVSLVCHDGRKFADGFERCGFLVRDGFPDGDGEYLVRHTVGIIAAEPSAFSTWRLAGRAPDLLSGFDQVAASSATLELSAMAGEYLQEWDHLRRLRRRIFAIVAIGAGILVAVPLVTALLSLAVAKIVGFVLFAGWAVALLRFFFVSGEYVLWPCPRCGKPFHYVTRWYGRWTNPFSPRCVHCGLPKWVDSDPDPKLKHELHPFRTNSILKLDQK